MWIGNKPPKTISLVSLAISVKIRNVIYLLNTRTRSEINFYSILITCLFGKLYTAHIFFFLIEMILKSKLGTNVLGI